jgi:hypothetical protein
MISTNVQLTQISAQMMKLQKDNGVHQPLPLLHTTHTHQPHI